MTYLSDLIGKLLVDVNEAPIGVIEEVIARAQGRNTGPRVTAVVTRREGISRIYSALGFVRITGDQVHMRYTDEKALRHVPTNWEIYLTRDLLGRQVIDFNHARAGRIQDVKLEWFEGVLFLTHIDIGIEEPDASLRNTQKTLSVERRIKRNRIRSLICWKDLELLPVEMEKAQPAYETKPIAASSRVADETFVAAD